MSYANNRKWADRYLGWAAEVLKENAGKLITVEVAPEDKDRKQATDLILHFDGGDIAFRIRRGDCGFRDLTIRTQYDNRPFSELHKIKQGFGDWYLYAWTDAGGDVAEWIIVDLDQVRKHKLWEGRRELPNGDGTWFIAIPLPELQINNCLVSFSLS